jgi:CRISPR-associated protein Cas2
MHYVVTYDITSDARRRQVYRTLERYGAWRQYSVFEAELTETQRVELESDLKDEIDGSAGDRIRIYRLCNACEEEVTDIGQDPPDEQSNVI